MKRIIGWMLIIGPREDMWPWFERQAQLGKELADTHGMPSQVEVLHQSRRKMILVARIVLWLYRSRLLQYVYSRMLSNAVIFFPLTIPM